MSSPAVELNRFVGEDQAELIAQPRERYSATTERVRRYVGITFMVSGAVWAMGSPLLPEFADFRLFALSKISTQVICFSAGVATAIGGYILCRGRPCSS